jgi:hypothetical protein
MMELWWIFADATLYSLCAENVDKPDTSKIETILRESDKHSKLDFQTVWHKTCQTKMWERPDVIDDEWIQICLNAMSCSYNLRH